MSDVAVMNQSGTSDEREARADRVYLPELDGLRFVAFALVYLFTAGFPQPMLVTLVGRPLAHAMRDNGWVGVQLFFILSGFLITTLLLREEAQFGRIDLRAFLVRRILRIWPLYYLTVAIGFPGHSVGRGLARHARHRELLSTHLAAFPRVPRQLVDVVTRAGPLRRASASCGASASRSSFTWSCR